VNFISFMVCACVPLDTRQWRCVWVIHGCSLALMKMVSYVWDWNCWSGLHGWGFKGVSKRDWTVWIYYPPIWFLHVYLTILFEVMVREKSVWGPSDFTFSISLVRKPITWAVKLTDLQRWRVQRLVWELRSGCKSLLQPQKLAPRLHCFDSLPRFHYGLTFLPIIFGLLIDVLDDLLQDCRVGKLVRGLGEANGLTWWFWLLISDPDEAWYLIWSFVVVFSFNLHSVASSLWCSLELVVCTSDSFNCPEASYLVSVVCHLTDTVSSSTCMWFGWNMISSFAPNQQNARSNDVLTGSSFSLRQGSNNGNISSYSFV